MTSTLTGNAQLPTLTICKERAFSSLEVFVLLYSLHLTWSFVQASEFQGMGKFVTMCAFVLPDTSLCAQRTVKAK